MIRFYLAVRRYAAVLMVFATSLAFAQERSVSGRITSADDNSAIPGVNILEKGTSNGTVSDADGNYRINVGPNAVLVFSFVGYTTQEVTVGTQSTVDVALASDITALSEVVVVGYGTQEKKEITGSVSSVKAEDFNKGLVNDPTQLIQGKVAGLSVTRPGSDPNAGFDIRLRGISTVGANTQPLIIIDGVLGADLRSVDPNDIASIDVLKDGSAAALYGSRASNGVILVTTKSGKSGKFTVDYNGSFSTESIARRLDLLSADEFRSLRKSIFNNDDGDFRSNTDWTKEISRSQALAHVHNLAISGGTSQTQYRISANYRNTQGIQRGSGFDQLITRVNINQKALNDKLTLSFNFANTNRNENPGFNEAFRYATIYNPTAPVRFPEGSTDPNAIRYGGYFQQVLFDFFNPVAIIEQNTRERQQQIINSSFKAEYEIADGLRWTANYAFQNSATEFGQYFSKFSFGTGTDRNGFAEVRNDISRNDLFETYGTLDRAFGDLNLTVVAGYSYQEFNNRGFGMNGGNFISDAFKYHNMGASQDFQKGLGSVFSYRDLNKLIAFFGRANLSFKDTYFVNATFRREGSTRNGANNKWGNFFGAGAAVMVSNLVDIPFLNSLKAKVGFGQTGNQPNFSYASLVRFGPQSNTLVNGQFIPSYGPVSNANPDLKWETQTQLNAGIEFTALKNRLSGTIEYFQKRTTDLILNFAVPVPPNLFGNALQNVGEMANSGIEVALDYAVIQRSNLTWSTGINFATLSTEFVNWNIEGTDQRLIANVGSPGQNLTPMIRVTEGRPFGEMWGLKFTGIGENGRWVYEDLDGNGVIDQEKDSQVIGNGLPKVYGGWNNTVTFGKFDFNVLFNFAFGHDMINQFRTFYEAPIAVGSYNALASTLDIQNLVEAPRFSSFHVENADYVRLNNATLGYNVGLGTGSRISKARLFLSGQNLFTITGYRGIDPEIQWADRENLGENGTLAAGIERRNSWFLTRTITAGVNITF